MAVNYRRLCLARNGSLLLAVVVAVDKRSQDVESMRSIEKVQKLKNLNTSTRERSQNV